MNKQKYFCHLAPQSVFENPIYWRIIKYTKDPRKQKVLCCTSEELKEFNTLSEEEFDLLFELEAL